MTSRRQQRRRLLDDWADSGLSLGYGRPSYQAYLRDPRWRLIANTAHRLFRARCWVCRKTQRDLEERGDQLNTAHIVYPPEAFTETVDPDDLTRSSVILLCRYDHQLFDAILDARDFYSIDDLRQESLRLLDKMRRQAHWSRDDED